jgi:hypothetical protein
VSSNGNPPADGEEPATPQGGEPAGEAEGPGVLGSLPRSRPSVRSPRRARSAPKPPPGTAGGDPAAAEPAVAETGPAEPAADEREKPHTATPGGPESSEDRGGPEADLERLARAGLSVAGGAAALGLRAAGRAAAALRDAVERR